MLLELFFFNATSSVRGRQLVCKNILEKILSSRNRTDYVKSSNVFVIGGICRLRCYYTL